MRELPKAYEPKAYEDKIYKQWEDSGLFNPDVCVEKGVVKADADPFSIVLPPPNVTGTLHMGHAAMLAIEDVMIRYHRMKGDRTLWVPGTDHAAVATESKVEQILIDKGMKKPKQELGREPFLQEVRDFAQASHDTIVNQARKMGASLDWSREAFTMDPVPNKVVRSIFKKMYDDGLIYRGYRVVNWSVKGQSTCSDDELVHVERPAKLYYFKYSHDFPITIATTRPETKLGDTAVAVHPTGRWQQYIGQTFVVENFGQTGHTLTLKVFGDEGIDDSFGTGALGVTTAHSPIDFEMYQKQKALGNDIGLIQVIGEDGNMTANAGGDYAGLPVIEARAKVVAWLEAQGLLEKAEDIVQNVGTSDRFKDVVEPLPKTQWFINVNKKFVQDGKKVSLKELMQSAVREKKITILPERFEKTYFHWIDNLRDWCISRQIWYGHQIPAYYDINDQDNDFTLYISIKKRELFEQLGAQKTEYGYTFILTEYTSDGGVNYSSDLEDEQTLIIRSHVLARVVEDSILDWDFVHKNINTIMGLDRSKPVVLNDQRTVKKSYVQDPDTLDTWFSAGLWTFSTLLDRDMKDGESFEDWVARSKDLRDFHPTSVLETGYDILFFWVARMILMTTYAVGDVPFKTVYLHGLVRDEQGRKMSKSLGNIINPLDMIEKYGTDATRLSLLIGSTPGNDVKLSEEKIAGFRNFTNKLWNISRFMLLNIPEPKMDVVVPENKTLVDRWILSRLDEVAVATRNDLEVYQFSVAGERLRDFTWNDLADWYLEIAKVEGNKSEILNYILNTILKLWHPFMPFVTETIWQEIYGQENVLMTEKFPETTGIQYSEKDNSDFQTLQNIITKIRALRLEYKIEPAQKTRSYFVLENNEFIHSNQATFLRLGYLESLELIGEIGEAGSYISFVESGIKVYLDFASSIDSDKEKTRLEKEISTVAPYVVALESRLAGDFAKNAPPMIVEKERQKLVEAQEKLAQLQKQLSSLAK